MLTSNNLSPQQKIERAHVELMGNKHTVAYSGVIMVGTYKILPDCPTAYTDGINCVYGESFIDKLKPAQLRAVILHENLHKMFQHLFVWKHLAERNAPVANKAMDFVINLIIDDLDKESNSFVSLADIKGVCLDEKFRGMDTQQVFNELMKDAKGGSGGKGKSGQGGLDEHDWGKAQELTPQQVQDIAREIDQAIRQGQVLAGKMQGNIPREFGELTQPRHDWRDQLSEFMTSTISGGDLSTWTKVNRRWLQYNMYMPTTQDETMGNLLIGVDLSGSVGGDELTQFMSHVVLMCNTLKPERVDLLYWDHSVNVHEVYNDTTYDKLLSSTKPVGGGGTSPEVIPAYIKQHKLNPACCIILTDGYFDNPGVWDQPVLWGICGGNRNNIGVGKTVFID